MENIRIVVDADGGDSAPSSPCAGAVEAVRKEEGFSVILAGRKPLIEKALAEEGYTGDRISILECGEPIAMAEPPVNAIRKKKDSSIVRGLTLLRNGEAEGFVSAGSTGAVIAGAQVIVGRLPGIRRSPLAILIPTESGVSLLLDCGGNVDARPEQLVEFALLGSVYMKEQMKVADPSVGIVNIGAEEEKGNALVKDAFPLLAACPAIRFTGSVEARDIPAGGTDVLVCDAFTGNVILKMYEGTASMFKRLLKNTIKSSFTGKIGGLLIAPKIKEAMKMFDTAEHGGAPLLGLRELVVKTHGSAGRAEISNSILQCVSFRRDGVTERMREALAQTAEGATDAP